MTSEVENILLFIGIVTMSICIPTICICCCSFSSSSITHNNPIITLTNPNPLNNKINYKTIEI